LKDQILNSIKNTETVQALHRHFKEGIERIGLYNCEDNVKATLAAVLSHEKRNHLFVCPNEIKAKQYVELINSILREKAHYLPPEPYHFLFLENHSREISNQRLVVLNEIANKKGKLIVTTPEALMKRMISKDQFKKARVSLKVGGRIETEDLIQSLEVLGFERVEQVERSGEFATRGGILDIFDPISPKPLMMR
jgi:transcription-repair coupling factor (superfamily II helicase)